MSAAPAKYEDERDLLRLKLKETEAKLAAAEDLLRAIRRGEVDALVVQREGRPAVYTLKSASEPYRLLIEQMAEGALTVADNGLILYCNAAFSVMTGRPREKLTGKLFQEMIRWPGGDAGQLVRETQSSQEIELKTASGMVPVLMSSSPVVLDDGTVHCIVVTDVSRQGIRLLHETIVESSADAIYAIDANGTIQSWNAAAEELFGFSAEEAIGSSIDILLPVGTRRQGWRVIRQVLHGDKLRFEIEYTNKAGNPLDIMISLAPIRERNGTVAGAAVITRDITERKRAEEEIVAARVKLEAALSSMSDAVFISDADGNLLHFNEAFARYCRYRDSDEFARGFDEYRAQFELALADGQILPVEQWPLSRALRGETGAEAEYTIRRKDTGESWIGSYSFAPILAPDGTITGCVVTSRDITEAKASQARLRLLNEELIHVARVNELSQVSAGIAHELNQPLAALLNYSALAKRMIASEQANAGEKAYAAIAKAGEQAERAGQIIRRMRDFVEKRETNRCLADINAIVDDAVALGLVGAKGDNITILLSTTPVLPPIAVDRVQIEQVLVNLLRNAAEAMASSPMREIRISTARLESGHVEVAVADTGPGVLPNVAERLFQPFVTSKSGGMGIGLAISRSIVEAHGGKLILARSGPDGTEFRFTLPAAGPH